MPDDKELFVVQSGRCGPRVLDCRWCSGNCGERQTLAHEIPKLPSGSLWPSLRNADRDARES